MISLASELTDAKGRRARAGWVFFDGECSVCIGFARRFARLLDRYGFGLAPLQSPRIRALLDLPEEELLREMRLLAPDGSVIGGADALLYIAAGIWWAWPLVALSRIDWVHRQLRRGYAWFAARRNCRGGACASPHGPRS